MIKREMKNINNNKYKINYKMSIMLLYKKTKNPQQENKKKDNNKDRINQKRRKTILLKQ